MTEIISSRRSLILGLGTAFIAAPAIVRASSLMKVKSVHPNYIAAWDVGDKDFTARAVFAEINGQWQCIESYRIKYNEDGTMLAGVDV